MEDKSQPSFLEFLPVSLFGAVMAFAGLSFSWGWAEKIWPLPGWIKEIFSVLAITIFIALTIAYILKWIRFPALVKTEFNHPVSVSFFGTFIIALLLLPGIILPYSASLAVIIWSCGACLMFLFAWLVLRKWIDRQQEPASALPAWIIPVVGTLDVPIVGYRLPIAGIHEICLAFFGIGIIFTIILLPVIISRLLFQAPLPEALQPTLLILIGPFALAFSGYESLTGVQDMMASVFYYFDLFLLLILGSKLVLLPQCCPFRVTWWAVGFPLVAITIASFRYASHKTNTIFTIVPAVLLILSTFIIVYLFCQSIYRLVSHQLLLPKPANEQATRLMEPGVH
ncbi:MAG: SLAC1 anion channel family protein [Bacteroidota bacterium]